MLLLLDYSVTSSFLSLCFSTSTVSTNSALATAVYCCNSCSHRLRIQVYRFLWRTLGSLPRKLSSDAVEIAIAPRGAEPFYCIQLSHINRKSNFVEPAALELLKSVVSTTPQRRCLLDVVWRSVLLLLPRRGSIEFLAKRLLSSDINRAQFVLPNFKIKI